MLRRAVTDGSAYLVTQTYADHENRPIWTRNGSEVTKNLYNAKGQLVSTSQDSSKKTPQTGTANSIQRPKEIRKSLICHRANTR